MCQDSRHNSVGCSASGALICCNPGVGWVPIHIKGELRKEQLVSLAQADAGWQDSFLCGFLDWASQILYVWGPPLLLCHVHLSQMAMASSAPASLEGKTENAREMEVTIFAKLISEWHLIPSAAFSLLKQAVWSSPHLRGGGCIKGKILGSCLPHPVLTS